MTTSPPSSLVDVAIVGGGPAGLAAALALGRACRSVVLFDAGVPRNEAATQIHNFVTRDGTPPSEFRRVARAQLAPYDTVQVRDEHVASIDGEHNAFNIECASGSVQSRRVILCTGMVDQLLDLPGFRDAWGHSVFQCPYCHGWEVRGRRWGYLALDAEGLAHGFPAMLTAWTDDVTVFVGPDITVSSEILANLSHRGIRVERSPVDRLIVEGRALSSVALLDGTRVACDALFAHPPQRHVDVVRSLDLELDEAGYVVADPMTRRTSVPGIYAAGDLTTRAQGAVFAAATGTQAAAMCNHDLCIAATR